MNIFGGLSIELLDHMDDVNHHQFELGAWVRAVLPGQPHMRTCRVLEIDTTSELPFKLYVWGGDSFTGQQQNVWAHATTDYEPSEVQELSILIKDPLVIGLVPRSNFDSFFDSCITTFQILTLADFQKVWYASVRGTNVYTSFYFILLIFIGHYMLFNLFVAIIIQGFAEERERVEREEKEKEENLASEQAQTVTGRRSGHSAELAGEFCTALLKLKQICISLCANVCLYVPTRQLESAL